MISNSVKTYTSFSTLIKYAHDLGKAKKSGNKEAIESAQEKLDNYENLVKNSIGMNIGTNLDIKI